MNYLKYLSLFLCFTISFYSSASCKDLFEGLSRSLSSLGNSSKEESAHNKTINESEVPLEEKELDEFFQTEFTSEKYEITKNHRIASAFAEIAFRDDRSISRIRKEMKENATRYSFLKDYRFEVSRPQNPDGIKTLLFQQPIYVIENIKSLASQYPSFFTNETRTLLFQQPIYVISEVASLAFQYPSFFNDEVKKLMSRQPLFVVEEIKDFISNNIMPLQKKSSPRSLIKEILSDLSRARSYTVKVKPEHVHWFPNGITASQWAAYYGDLYLVDLLLDLGFEYRAKEFYGEIIEYNPLHVAIKMGYFDIAQLILKKEDLLSRQSLFFPWWNMENSIRLIDEVTNDKQTPWLLALIRWKETGDIKWPQLIASYQPSVEFHSLFEGNFVDNKTAIEKIAKDPSDIKKIREMFFKNRKLRLLIRRNNKN